MINGPRLASMSMWISGLAIALLPQGAQAHFILSAPASWDNMADTYGDPQKSAPCGQADPGMTAVPSGAVTSFHAGDTVTITVNETIFHPGHYRVSLANSQSELPADPQVTAGSTPCGSTTIEANPTLPLLADGMLVHNAQLSGPQSFDVTLPADFTCTKCTLQVVEFMSNHPLNNPGGCFYHHCADVSIQAAGTTTGAGGSAGAGNDAGTGNATKSSGCSYAGADRGPSAGGTLLGLALAIIWLARRRASIRSVATKLTTASASNPQ